jgi:CO/xanthine dehydrogenase FAD-binding subunit
VKPPVFQYHDPRTLPEALELLRSYGGEAKVLAGGQSLVPLLNLRLVRPKALVDINRIGELDYIEEEDGWVRIGAVVRQRAAERSSLVRERVPLLSQALRWVGHPAIRNRGTVCGSLAHADPAAELGAVAAALDARFVIQNLDRQRVVGPEAFFVTYLTTSLEPDEILVEVRFPTSSPGWGWVFEEVSVRHGDYALAAVAAGIRLEEGRVVDARLAYAGVGPIPVRLREAEAALLAASTFEGGVEAAAQEAMGRLQPDGDLHASSEFRRHLAAALTRRALRRAYAAMGGIR